MTGRGGAWDTLPVSRHSRDVCMTHIPYSPVWFTAAIVILTANAAAARQSAPAPAAAVTPGSVALLANTGDAAAVEQIRTALSHADATVRAVAARVAAIGRIRGLSWHVRNALKNEADEAAAAEQVRALLYFGDADSIAVVEAYLRDAPLLAVRPYLEWLALARPENVAERLERLYKSRPAADLSQVSDLVARAVVLNPKDRDRVLRAGFDQVTAPAWRGMLDALGMELAAAESSVIQQALRSDKESIREATVWAIVARLVKGEPVAASVLDAALPAETPTVNAPTVSVGWEQFGRELIARRHRQLRTPDRSAVIRGEARPHFDDARLLLRFKEILPGERSAVAELVGEERPSKAPPPLDPTPVRGQSAMRTAPIPWPALLPDLLRTTGCPVTETTRLGVFEVSYRPDGRPLSVGIINTDLPPECGPALAAVARLTLADTLQNVVEGEKQFVVVPISAERLACAAASAQAPRLQGRRVGAGRIMQPTKTRDVRPVYPRMAQQFFVQGMVILDAIISATGCVANLKVLRSVHPLLDLEAVKAVSGWRFTPTLLDGVPVPVIMTVTVNFELQ